MKGLRASAAVGLRDAVGGRSTRFLLDKLSEYWFRYQARAVKNICRISVLIQIFSMSRADLMETVDSMGREDRAFLAAYLRAKDISEERGCAEQASHILSQMKNGDCLDSASLRQIHASLESKGL